VSKKSRMTRGGLGSLGLVLAGLVLGGYVVVAWPDGGTTQKTPGAKSQPVRATASVDSYPESELAGMAGGTYPGDLFAYEPGPTPFLDAVIAAPPAVDAR
jgi:hypothetical protein